MSEAVQDDQTPAPDTSRFASLAAQQFGQKYHGEVPETPSEPLAEDPSPAEPEGAEAPEIDAQEPQEPDTPEEVTIESFSELIESQGWDPEWANSLRLTTKVDGEERSRSIAELIAIDQTQEAASKRLEDAKAKSQAMREQAKAQQDAAQAQIAVLGSLVQQVEAQINAEFAGVDWKTLEANDPAEFARLRLKAQDKIQGIATMKAKALEQYKQALAAQSEQQQAQTAEAIQRGHEVLLQVIPSWSDAEVAKADQTALVDYLTRQPWGYTPEQIQGNTDPGLVVLAHKARLYDELQDKTAATAKRVAKVPKVLKPGAPKSPDQSKRETESALRRRLRNGDQSAAVELMRSRRN